MSDRAKSLTNNVSNRSLSKSHAVAGTPPSSSGTAKGMGETLSMGSVTETSEASSSRRRISKPSLRLRESLANSMPTTANTLAKTSLDNNLNKPSPATKRATDPESAVTASKQNKNDKGNRPERKWVNKDM